MATDSLIGYGVGNVNNPATAADSQIGFSVGNINQPAASADSGIGFATGNIRSPHKPVRVITGSNAFVYRSTRTFDGTTWR